MNVQIFRTRNQPGEVPDILNGVEAFCATRGLAREIALDVRLVAEEVLTNIVKYAHEEAEDHWIELRLSCSSLLVRLEFRDEGAPFNPLEVPAIASRADEREIGGLGIHLVRSLVDEASYSRDGTVNVLVLSKRLESTV